MKQPGTQSGLHFFFRTPLIERVDGLSPTGKRDVSAGEAGFPAILRHESHQQAFRAGLWMVRVVEVETSGRILKNKIRPPRKAWGLSVPTAFDEGKFGSQDFKNITLVRWHRKNPGVIVKGAQANRGDKSHLVP